MRPDKIENEIFEFFGKMPEEKNGGDPEKVGADAKAAAAAAPAAASPKNGKSGKTFMKVYHFVSVSYNILIDFLSYKT